MDVSHLLDGLNPAQREAVTASGGHYLVLAGAGSGKTRVLTHRIAWLNEVHGVPAHGILAVTFTNKAAAEMRGRAEQLLRNGARGMWIGTFHGLCHRLLRLHFQEAKLPEGFQVLDSDDQLRLVKRVVQQLELDDARFPPRQIAWWINAQKDEGRRPQHLQPAPGDAWLDVMQKAYALYQERCDRAGLVDFAELLLRAHELLRDNAALLAHYRRRFGEILVDEFQDTNAIQYAFVRVLAGSEGHVFVVGDDDQAIWRGGKRLSSSSSPCTTRLTSRSWSSESSTWKPSGSFASCQCRRSSRWARPWNVPIHMPRVPPRSCASTRWRISAAALLVKVTARMPWVGTPNTSCSQAMRWVSTRVLPEPAPASTR